MNYKNPLGTPSNEDPSSGKFLQGAEDAYNSLFNPTESGISNFRPQPQRKGYSFLDAYSESFNINENNAQPSARYGAWTLNNFSTDIFGTRDLKDSYNTQLAQEEEEIFSNNFSKTFEKKYGKSITEVQQNYDVKGLFKATINQDLPDSLPSNFTKPNHPVFSADSIYNGQFGYEGGTWDGNKFTPSDTIAINPNDTIKYFTDGDASTFELDSEWIEKSSAYKFTEEASDDYTNNVSKFHDNLPILNDANIVSEARSRGEKTWTESLMEGLDPRRENAVMTAVLEYTGFHLGAEMAKKAATKVIAGNAARVAIPALAKSGPIGWAVLAIGLVGSMYTGSKLRDVGIWLSGNDARRRDAREAMLRLNADNFDGPDEEQELIGVVESWKREQQIEELRGYGDGISGWVSQVIDMSIENLGYMSPIAGSRKAVTTLTTKYQKELARKLNRKGVDLWEEATKDYLKSIDKSAALSANQKIVRDQLMSGPLGITKKQSRFILKQTEHMNEAKRTSIIPQMISHQLAKNTARFSLHGEKMSLSLKALLNPGTVISTITAGTSLISQTEQRLIREEMLSVELDKNNKYDFSKSFRNAKDTTKEYLKTYNEVIIESFSIPAAKILLRTSGASALFGSVINGVRKTKPFKLAGNAKASQAVKAWAKDNPLFKLKAKVYDRLSEKIRFDGILAEGAEEYITMISNAVLNLDERQRKDRDLSYSENVIEQLLFPVKKPYEASVILGSLALIPMASAAGGIVTGQLTSEEYKQTQNILKRISKAEGVVTEDDVKKIIQEVAGIGESIYNKKGANTLLGRILGWFDPASKIQSQRILGQSISEYKEAVDQRVEVIKNEMPGIDDTDALDRAVKELSAESLMFGIVVKDNEEKTYFQRLIADKRIHKVRSADQEEVYNIFSVLIDGVELTGARSVFRATQEDSEGIEYETTEGNYGTVTANVEGTVYKGSDETVEEFKKQLVTIAKDSDYLEDTIKPNSVELNKDRFRRISFLKTRIKEAEANNEDTRKLINQLDNAVADAAKEFNKVFNVKSKTLRGRILNQRILNQEINRAVIKIADLIQDNPNLEIRGIQDLQLTGEALAQTGRTGNRIIDVGGFNAGSTVYLGGLPFLKQGEFARTLDEETREVNVKEKFDGKINLTSLSEDALESFQQELKEFIESTGKTYVDPEDPDDEEEAEANTKARIDKAKKLLDAFEGTSAFENFISISQAMSGEGRDVVLDVIDLMSPETKSKFDAAILAEYTGSTQARASDFMTPEQKQIAQQKVSVWNAAGGKKMVEDFIGQDIPQTLLDIESRLELADNEVKIRDRASGQNRTYVKEDGVWRNVKYNRPITGAKLIAKLEDRLIQKGNIKDQMSPRRRRKEEARRAYYQKQFKSFNIAYNKVVKGLEDRLNNETVELDEEATKATNEILKILKSAGRINIYAGTPLLTQLIGKVQTYYNQIPDVTFSTDEFLSNESNSNENNDEALFDAEFFDVSAKSFINSMFIKEFGTREGSLIIYELRNSEWLADIVRDRESFERWTDQPDNIADNFFQTFLKSLTRESFINPITGTSQTATYDDMYEFWKTGQSLRLFTVYELFYDKKSKTIRMRNANSYNFRQKVIFNAKSILGIDSTSNNIVEQYLNAMNAPIKDDVGDTRSDKLYAVIQNITHLNREDIKTLDQNTKGIILQVLQMDAPEGVSVLEHLREIFYGNQRIPGMTLKRKVGEKEYEYKNIIELLEPIILQREFNLKTRFTNVEGKEKSALLGDSHVNLVIDELTDQLEEEYGFKYADRQKASMLFDGFKAVDVTRSQSTKNIAGDELFNSFQTIFNDSLEMFNDKFFYMPLQRFSEKGKMIFVARPFFGEDEATLIAEATKARDKWLKNQKTEAGRAILGDPLIAVKEILQKRKTTVKDPLTGKVKSKDISLQDLMEIHYIINSVDISYQMNGTLDDYVTGKGRQSDINNVLARNSQIATDGIRFERGFNLIKVPEIINDEYGSEAFDGEFILFGDAPAELAKDFGVNISSNDDGNIETDSKGRPIIPFIKAHISETLPINGILRRILVKVNMVHQDIALDSTRKNGRGPSAIQDLIDYVNNYNKGKAYEDQIHGVSFASGAKFFPIGETDYKSGAEPTLLKLPPGRNLIRSQALGHNNDITHQGRMMKQMHAHMSALNNDAVITTPSGTQIAYSNNGAKAARLRNEVIQSISTEQSDVDIKELVSSVSPPSVQKAFSTEGGIENPNDIRYASFFMQMLMNKISKITVPNMPRTALQVVGGANNTPDNYGPITEGNYRRTSRVSANLNFARYNTYTEFTEEADVVNYIMENRKFFYDMFFISEEGYPTDEVMVHELDIIDGKYVIPGEIILSTRVPSGSNASHSFGRLTEPVSNKFKRANVIVTNEGIRLSKGEDLDGDKAFTTAFSRSLFTIKNGRFARENGKIVEVNPDGIYNMIITFDGWNESKNKESATENAKSKLNRAFNLEIAIWHTGEISPSYELQGDIPKGVFDAELVNERKENSTQDLSLNTARGLANQAEIFAIRSDAISIFAKSNATFSWLMGTQDLISLELNFLGETFEDTDIVIKESINFENYTTLKRSLDLILNQALDDNKDMRLFFLNVNEVTTPMLPILIMMNVNINDFPADNSQFGNSQAANQIKKIFQFLQSDFVQEYSKLEQLKSYSPLNPVDRSAYKKEYNRLLKKYGATKLSFMTKLSKISASFKQAGTLLDLSFGAPQTLNEYMALRIMKDKVNTEGFMSDLFYTPTVMDLSRNNPTVAAMDYALQEYDKVFESTVYGTIDKYYELDYYDSEMNAGFQPLSSMNDFIKYMNIGLQLRSLKRATEKDKQISKAIFTQTGKEVSQMTLKEFLNVMNTRALNLTSQLKTEDLRKLPRSLREDRAKDISKSLEIKDGRMLFLKLDFRMQELPKEIEKILENSFKELSLFSQMALATHHLAYYGNVTSAFKGSVLGFMPASLSYKINQSMEDITESSIASAKFFPAVIAALQSLKIPDASGLAGAEVFSSLARRSVVRTTDTATLSIDNVEDSNVDDDAIPSIQIPQTTTPPPSIEQPTTDTPQPVEDTEETTEEVTEEIVEEVAEEVAEETPTPLPDLLSPQLKAKKPDPEEEEFVENIPEKESTQPRPSQLELGDGNGILEERADPIKYTPKQKQALIQVSEFLDIAGPQGRMQEFLLAGYAGTGKTTVVENIINYTAKLPHVQTVVVAAPTNKAKEVLQGKLSGVVLKRDVKVKTLDSLLYARDKNDRIIPGSLEQGTVVIIDEASMMDNVKYADLQAQFSKHPEIKFIYLGDSFQLPPVGNERTGKFSIGSGVDGNQIPVTVQSGRDEFSIFGIDLPPENKIELTEVRRQTGESTALQLATAIRTNSTGIVPTESKGEVIIEQSETSLLNSFIKSYKENPNSVIITYINKTRNELNSKARAILLPNAETDIENNEPMMGVGNSPRLSNGQSFEVLNPSIVATYEGPIYDLAKQKIIKIHVVEYEREVVQANGRVKKEMHRGLFIPELNGASATHQELTRNIKDGVISFDKTAPKNRSNSPFAMFAYEQDLVESLDNGVEVIAPDLEIFTRGYAISGHKSQGSQWANVFVNHTWWQPNDETNARHNWLYTAITRTSDKVHLNIDQSKTRSVSMNWNDISSAASGSIIDSDEGNNSFSVDDYNLSLDGFVPIPRRPILNKDLLDQYSKKHSVSEGTVETANEYSIDISNKSIPWQKIFTNFALIDDKEQFVSDKTAKTNARKRIANKIKRNLARVKRLAPNFDQLPADIQSHLITNFNSLSKETNKAIRLVGNFEYKKAADAMSNIESITYEDIVLKDLIVTYYAIEDSIELSKADKAPNVLLQTGRTAYGILPLDMYSYIVESDLHKDLTDAGLSALDLYGKVSDQYSLIDKVESIGDMKLLGRIKKAIRLINGVPTKYQLTNNIISEDVSPVNELSFSLMSMLETENTNLGLLRGPQATGTTVMRNDLVKTGRTYRSLVETGRIKSKNASRLIGLYEYISKDGKTIKTNKNIKAWGEKVQRILPYIIEHINNEDINLSEVTYITEYEEDMVFVDSKMKNMLEGTVAENWKFIPPPLAKIMRETRRVDMAGAIQGWFNANSVSSVVQELEAERKKIAPHLPSLNEADGSLAKLAQEFQNVLKDQFDLLNEEGKILGGEFIAHRDNYVPHDNYKKRGDNLGARGAEEKLETARAENARMFKTFLEAATMGGLLPVNPGYVPTVDRYFTTTAHSLRTKLAAFSFATTLDEDMMPYMLFDSADQMGMLTESSAEAMILALEAGMKAIKPDFKFKTKRFQSSISRLTGMIREFKPEELGYKRIKTGFKNVKYAWVKEGTPSFIAKHIFYDKEMTDSKTFNKFYNAQLLYSQAAKSASIFISLFHPIALAESFIAMEGLTGIDNKGTILTKLLFRPFKTYKDLKSMYNKMVTDPNFTREWQQSGLMFDIGNSPDIKYAEYNTFIDNITEKLISNKITAPLGFGFKMYGGLKKTTDRWLWEVGLPMMKFYAANSLYTLEGERAIDNNEEFKSQETREAISAYINDAFGSQEWEQYIWANPKVRSWLQTFMFAPDWTLSALNISGVTHMTPLNRAIGNPTSQFHLRNRVERYWTGFAGIVLLALPNMLQALIYNLAGAIDPDDEDHIRKENMWTWENEKGHKLDVDVTPIFRLMGRDDYGKTKERKIYLRWGKQAYEVFEGWLGGPQEAMKTAMGKSSIGVKTFTEQFLNLKTLGWETEWAESEFFESILGVEGKFWDGRAASVLKKFLPLSVQPIFDEISTPGTGRPPSFFAPVRLGTSGGAGAKEIASVIDIYARYSLKAKVKGFRKVEQMESLVGDILIAVEKNGYNPDEIFRQGLSQVRTKYYEDYFEALQKDDEEAAIAAVENLHRIRTTLPAFERSMRDRLGTQDVSLNLFHQKITNDFYESFRNNVNKGMGINSWAFPATTNIFRRKKTKRMF